MDLLNHEMLITSLFSSFCIPLNRHKLFLNLFLINIIESNLSLM